VIAGTVLVLFGAIKNSRYFGAVVSNRGPLRRRPEDAPAPIAEKPRDTKPPTSS